MGRPADELGLVDVVRPHPHRDEPLDERLHRGEVVVDAAHQHRLVADGHAGLGELRAGLGRLGRELLRVVEVGVQPDRVVRPQQVAQIVRHAERERHRQPRTEPDDLDVWDRAEFAEQPAEVGLVEDERVAAGQQHVTDLGVRREVVDGLLQFVLPHHEVGVADHPLAEAVAAVDRALGRDAEGHAVAVVMDEIFHRRVPDLVQRVHDADDVGRHLAHPRDDLPPDGTVGIVGVHQARVVRRDVPAEHVGRGLDGGEFVGGGVDVLPERFLVVDAVAHLPAPVGPRGRGDVGRAFHWRCAHGRPSMLG